MLRLDKYISNATDLSRTNAKRLIKNGVVCVNDEIASNPAQKISGEQDVTIEGSTISKASKRYFMLNKPAGVVSVTKDNHNPTAISLMYEHRSEDLQIAGLLDIDTTGLLLITDDGQWNHRLTSPRSDCAKIYQVELAEAITPEYPQQLAEGVLLEGEKHRCMPATMEIVDEHTVNLTIAEGKYHQVKRIFVALGNQVVSLHRFKVGDIVLDPELESGEYRRLTALEVASIL
jgi:16S rRNA pseudouridine516 synthase